MKNKNFKKTLIGLTISIILVTTTFSSAADHNTVSREPDQSFHQINNDSEKKFYINDQVNDNHISIQYSFQRPTIKKVQIGNEMYDKVYMEKASSEGNPGEPALPVMGAKILLPPGTTIGDIIIKPGEKINLGEKFFIEPAEEPTPLSAPESTPSQIQNEQNFNPNEIVPTPLNQGIQTMSPHKEFSLAKPNKTIYDSHGDFPNDLFTYSGMQYSRGFCIVLGSLHPVHYIPREGILYYYTDITITIEIIKDAKTTNSLFRGIEADTLAINNIVDNPSIVALYSGEKREISSRDNYDLLILTTDELKDGFIPLKEVHDADGIATTIKTLNDIGKKSSDITPDDIRDFIREEYTTHGISYVLIGGDIDVIPAQYLYYGYYEGQEYNAPSDVYYACLDGTYNYDGDSLWGESTDGPNGGDVDLFAEVYVGRACVETIDEVNNFVDKTIAYLTIDPHDEYLNNVVLAGEYLWGPPEYPLTFGCNYMDELIDESHANGYYTVGIPSNVYTIDTLYDRDWPGFDINNPWNTGWPASEMINRINEGQHIINHLGHSDTLYSMKMVYGNVYQLTNTKYCFIYSQGCYAGSFDLGDCMAEYFTVKTNHGAFAAIMNVRYGWGAVGSTNGANQHYNREFWDAVFNEGKSTLGAANQDSKEDNAFLITDQTMRWCYYEITLFGDPAIDFFGHTSTNPPNQPKKPQGIESGRPGIDYFFATNTSDPEEDEIYYMWDWGDGTTSSWLGPYNSGETCTITHNWTEPGMFNVRVKARDPWYKVSEWSEHLTVDIHIDTIYVNDDAPLEWYDAMHVRTIQEGINNITYAGDTVYVFNGSYHENIVIDDMISLIGESKYSTIIEGDAGEDVICVNADNVLLTGFTIEHGKCGIHIAEGVEKTTITDTVITVNSEIGIHIENASYNTITENNITNNGQFGIYITSADVNPSAGNLVYHNNFIINPQHAYAESNNIWDNSYPLSGNYWDDYHGNDNYYGPHQDLPGSDGVGDTSYMINENGDSDCYPLMNLFEGIPPVPPLDIVYVNDDFNASTPGWGYKFFNSVQKGINAVEEKGTVYIYEGLYTEQVEVNKTVILLGENRTNSIINGNGTRYTIRLSADHVNISRLTIRNHGFSALGATGILISSDDNTVVDTDVSECNYFGFYIVGSRNKISDNKIINIIDRAGGIFLYNDAAGNLIKNNIIINATYVGIWLIGQLETFLAPFNNTIEENTIQNCSYGVALIGSSGNTVIHNTITNATFYSDGDGGIGIFSRDNYNFRSENNKIIENTIYHNEYCGIFLANSEENSDNYLFSGNSIANSGIGVFTMKSYGNTFRDNDITISDSGLYGPNYGFYIYDDISLNSDIDTSNKVNGVSVLVLSNVDTPIVIEDMNLDYPEMTYATNAGIITLYNCTHVQIKNCSIANNSDYGIYLYLSSFTAITSNMIRDNHNVGIEIDSNSHDNNIYNNNFINNIKNADDKGSNNIWNLDYPAGGNFWANYNGNDDFHGPNQNIPGSDGIGDKPYNISVLSKDYYPFIFQDGWNLNYPPYKPYNPDPANNATNINGDNVVLQWNGGDPDSGDTVTYDVFFGGNNPPPQVVWNQSSTVYDPGTLDLMTQYFWQIVARDSDSSDHCIYGPVWRFITGDPIPPEWRDQGQSSSMIQQGGSIVLSAQARDNIGLTLAWLATNETGKWETFSGNNWWNRSWEYCKEIIINHNNIDADLTNFTVLISCTSSDFIAHAQPDGDDFVFVDATNTTVYSHEIEYYNSATGELAAWVKIPFLSSTQDTIFYMYYGNAGTGRRQDLVGTWDSNFSMVNHLTGTTSTDLKDSSANHWDVTSSGGNPAYNQVGKAGKCVDFDGAGSYLQASGFRLPADSSYTGSAWVYVDGNAGLRRYVFEGVSSNLAISLLVWTNETFKNYAKTTTATAACYSSTTVNVASPQWYYISTRVDAANDRLDLFVNGVKEGTSAISGTVNPETQGLNIGTYRSANMYWMNGKIDEIRISNVVRGNSWIKTEYNNIAFPSVFATVGEETQRSGGSKYRSPLSFDDVANQWMWSNFTWQNPEIPEGRQIGWRIYYFDTVKNVVSTDIMNFLITTPTQINPPSQPTDITPWHICVGDLNKGIGAYGKLYTYRSNSTEVGNDLYFTFYWGDTTSTVVGPVSGVASALHAYVTVRTFNITVTVKHGPNGVESNPSPIRTVQMFKLGDCSGDGQVTNADIDIFVDALGGKTIYYLRHPMSYWYTADCQLDYKVTFADIDPFVMLLGKG